MDYILQMIAARDLAGLLAHFFDVQGTLPVLKHGMYRETETWDYKSGLPSLREENDAAWSDVASHVMAFHNAKGGIIFFGVGDDFQFRGTGDRLDAKRFNDKIRRYVGDQLWVDFSVEFPQPDGRYLGVAVIPPHSLIPVRARTDAAPRASGEKRFLANDLCIRIGDETRVLHGIDAESYLRANRLPSPDAHYLVRDSSFRILRPDWDNFIIRDQLCEQTIAALYDPRTYVTTLTGIGGTGKTALASWAVIDAYKNSKFEYITSLSAKDRELTPSGIRSVTPSLTTFESLLRDLLDLLGFSDVCTQSVEKQEEHVRDLLKDTSMLLFVDNLETVDDRRVIRFLETLPLPVKAITTSRQVAVRVAANPIAVGPLTPSEAIEFMDSTARRKGKVYLSRAREAERQRLVEACSRLPLALQWVVGNAQDVATALALADEMSTSGKRNEELLEFCFRRVHEMLSPVAKMVLGALSLNDEPKVIEPLAVAVNLPVDQVEDGLAVLEESGLIERVWDSHVSDFAYAMLGLTRRFARRELQKDVPRQTRMRQRLTDYYDAMDVPEDSRAYVKSLRTYRVAPETLLVETAIEYRRKGKIDEAERYFRQAIGRNAKSWRAHRELAELLRDRKNIPDALSHYERAAEFCPAKGADRALVYREWGMLIRTSGMRDAQAQAILRFEEARRETPNDEVLLHALAGCMTKEGKLRRAVELLEKLCQSRSPETRARSYELLISNLRRLNEIVRAADVESQWERDDAARISAPRSGRTVQTSTRPLLPTSPPRSPNRRKR
ncbi:MAG TPA: RNA-binding domain-containing protein [Kofleriaceae bacterium]|nr:RNA-binding domain-containing protein [Kofleriaceae bacterium]